MATPFRVSNFPPVDDCGQHIACLIHRLLKKHLPLSVLLFRVDRSLFGEMDYL